VNVEGKSTGHALAGWLEQHHPSVPVLLTSGDESAASGKLSSASNRAFVAKPYTLAEIDQRIKEMLAR
jgi:hypothetical protein